MKTLTARNPSEARGIRKALKAAGVKFEFKGTGPGKKKKKKARRNPKRRTVRRRATRKTARRRRR